MLTQFGNASHARKTPETQHYLFGVERKYFVGNWQSEPYSPERDISNVVSSFTELVVYDILKLKMKGGTSLQTMSLQFPTISHSYSGSGVENWILI